MSIGKKIKKERNKLRHNIITSSSLQEFCENRDFYKARISFHDFLVFFSSMLLSFVIS